MPSPRDLSVSVSPVVKFWSFAIKSLCSVTGLAVSPSNTATEGLAIGMAVGGFGVICFSLGSIVGYIVRSRSQD